MRARILVATALAIVSVQATSHAAEDVCGDAYTQAQVQRRAGKLRSAKQSLIACSQEVCSSAIRVDCLKWTDEVERALSTVIFDVKASDGSDVTDVKVYSGDELLASSLDGRQISMDPGEVTLRFVRGAESIEKRVVVHEGEKFRTIHIDLPAAAAAKAKASTGVVVAAPSSSTGAHPIPTLSWILGGVGAAGVATFGVFSIVGYSKEASLRDGCYVARSCSSSDVQAARTDYLIGDIALGVGVVSLAVAVGYWLLSRPAESRQQSQLNLTPLKSAKWAF